MTQSYQNFLTTAAQAYGFDPDVLRKVNKYENSGRATFDLNRTDSNAQAGHPSAGPMQFIETTFNDYAKKAKAANPNAWKGIPLKWENPYAQALAASWAMANGKGNAWSTYDRAVKAAGGVQRTTAQTTPAATTATSATPGVTSTDASGLDAQKRAVLASVFDKNPGMQRVLGLVDRYDQLAPKVDVVRPTSAVSKSIATGAGGVGTDGAALVSTALAEVGKTANDALKYIKAGGGTGKEPWCGDFVMWVFKQKGMQPPPARSVPALMAWAKKNQKIVKNPKPGDLVTFDWNGDGTADHVEMVTSKIKGGVATVGGNTSGSKSSSQVAAKNRTSNILGYVSAA